MNQPADLLRRSSRIHSIDHLRVYAALTVLFGHAVHFLGETPYYHQNTVDLQLYRQGTGAVVFMAIASFIALNSERDNFGSAAAGWSFMVKRVLRLAPLYWIFTTMWLAIAILLPQLIDMNKLEFRHVVSSYLFLPCLRPADGHLRPILSLGWVLNYIVWFSLLFGICMTFKRRAGVIIAYAMLIALYLAGLCWDVQGTARFFFDGYPLVFVLGMIAVPIYGHLRDRVSIPVPVSILAVCVLFIMSWEGGGVNAGRTTLSDLWLFVCGWLIVMVASVTKPLSGKGLFSVTWDALAKSSYSIYLSQPFSLGLFVLMLKVTGIRGAVPYALAIVLAMVVALIGGVVVYHVVEKRLLTMTRNLGDPRTWRIACPPGAKRLAPSGEAAASGTEPRRLRP